MVASADLSFHSDSYPRVFVFAILFWRIKSEVSGSARFILPVTGNRTYSEFLFHPFLYICNSFSFPSALLLFSIRTYSAGAWLQLCTVCTERLSYSFAWIVCSFAEIFHLFSAFHFLFPWPKLWSFSTTLPKQWGGLAAHFASSPKIGS